MKHWYHHVIIVIIIFRYVSFNFIIGNKGKRNRIDYECSLIFTGWLWYETNYWERSIFHSQFLCIVNIGYFIRNDNSYRDLVLWQNYHNLNKNINKHLLLFEEIKLLRHVKYYKFRFVSNSAANLTFLTLSCLCWFLFIYI